MVLPGCTCSLLTGLGERAPSHPRLDQEKQRGAWGVGVCQPEFAGLGCFTLRGFGGNPCLELPPQVPSAFLRRTGVRRQTRGGAAGPAADVKLPEMEFYRIPAKPLRRHPGDVSSPLSEQPPFSFLLGGLGRTPHWSWSSCLSCPTAGCTQSAKVSEAGPTVCPAVAQDATSCASSWPASPVSARLHCASSRCVPAFGLSAAASGSRVCSPCFSEGLPWRSPIAPTGAHMPTAWQFLLL